MAYATTPKDNRTKRTKLITQLAAMKNERASWDPHWMEIEKFLFPRGGRFTASDVNQGGKKHNSIYDNTGTRSLGILAAGLMAGATNPVRPWFKLAVADRDLMQSEAVKIWLNKVTQLLLDIFARSNTYRAFHTLYEELAGFGTGCSIVVDSFENVLHHHTITAGEYAYAANQENVIDSCAREFKMTVAQMVERFGYDQCSLAVQRLWDKGQYTSWVDVVHLIGPRRERDKMKKDAQNMAFYSCYFEPGREDGEDKFLRESGFKSFRVLAPRWTVKSNDIYGHSAGMEALGDIKSLQHEQLRKAEGIDYQTKPALSVPAKLKNQQINRLPGGVVYHDSSGPNDKIQSLFDVNLNLSHLLEDIQDVRGRIQKAFFVDVFTAISQFDPGKMTATEVAARQNEGLLQLGPVLERLHNEMLGPFIDMAFTRLIEARVPGGGSLLPEPPDELTGAELKIEYTSILAQAQRSINTNATDRWVMSLGEVAKAKPTVLDKFDEDKWAEKHADDLGVDPELIVADEQVALIRKARAQQQQAMAQAAMINQGADTAAKLANADTSGKNALTDVTRNIGG